MDFANDDELEDKIEESNIYLLEFQAEKLNNRIREATRKQKANDATFSEKAMNLFRKSLPLDSPYRYIYICKLLNRYFNYNADFYITIIIIMIFISLLLL